MTRAEFNEAASAYCLRMGASVSGGGRTRARNEAVGGHPQSYHLSFKAVDVVYDDPAPAASVRKHAAKKEGLRCVVEDDHDHLQPL
jgi:hypothetical protein